MKAVREKDNAGIFIWRVNYFVANRRVRKTFHSKNEANSWIALNGTIATNEGRIFWEAWNAIEDAERHDLLAALSLIRSHRVQRLESRLTLAECARKQIAVIEAIETSLLLRDAVELYLGTKVERKRKGSVSAGWLNVLGPCLRRLGRELPNKTLVEFTTEEVEEYLDDQDWSPRTFNNYRDYLAAVYKWAIDEKYVKENPVIKIEKFAKKMITREVVVPAVPTINKILNLARQEKYLHLKPALDLGFGMAMRSSEITGMVWENITKDVVHVPSTVAKGGQARNISPRSPLDGVFRSLLARKATGPIVPKGWRRDLTKLFEEAGLGKPRNIMRRSGGSFHFHATRSEALTQEMMGHTEESQIFTSSYKALRYGDADTKTPISNVDGEAFYKLWR